MVTNYVEVLAEAIRERVSPDKLPDENSRVLFRIYAVLAIAKGDEVTVEDVHAAWSAWMTGVDPTHPALVPFDQLSHDAVEADRPYVDAIREASK